MKIEKVQGTFPGEYQQLRGGTFINVHNQKVIIGTGTDQLEIDEWYTHFTTDPELSKVKIEVLVTLAQKYLDDTDHKFFSRYKPKKGEDLAAIEAKRDEYREFIRANKD